MIFKIGGFFFILLALFSLKDFRNLNEVLSTYDKVKVKITYVDPCGIISDGVYYYIKFQFNNKTYVKMVGSDACKKWTVGNEYVLGYNRKQDSFHLDNETLIWPIISGLSFLIFAFFCFRQSSRTT